MPAEQLTYAQIAERLSVSAEAARAIVKRHRLPRSRRNDGKTLAAIDLKEIRHIAAARARQAMALDDGAISFGGDAEAFIGRHD